MGYLNGDNITVDAILTKYGRRQLAEGKGRIHGPDYARFHPYCRWHGYPSIRGSLFVPSESMEPQDIFLGKERTISKDIPN